MTNDHFYLETPMPYLRASTIWLDTLKQAINDAPVNSLVRGHYDENGHVVLPGHVFAVNPSETADYLNADNFSTGLDIVSNSTYVMANATGSIANGGCCIIF